MHERLESDPETLKALEELGIKPATPETRFKDLASILLGRQSASWSDTQWREFWQLASTIDRSASAGVYKIPTTLAGCDPISYYRRDLEFTCFAFCSQVESFLMTAVATAT